MNRFFAFGRRSQFCLSLTLKSIAAKVGRMFANGPGDLGSILGYVIPKTLKMVLDPYSLNTQQYKVHIKVKWSNSGKGVVPFPTFRCSSYWKGSLLVALNYGHQLYLLFGKKKIEKNFFIIEKSFVIFTNGVCLFLWILSWYSWMHKCNQQEVNYHSD